jgi:hypothetical protein
MLDYSSDIGDSTVEVWVTGSLAQSASAILPCFLGAIGSGVEHSLGFWHRAAAFRGCQTDWVNAGS